MIQLNKKYNFIFKRKTTDYLIFLFFCFYFFVGLNIYKDYGISIDEPFHRTSGFYWYIWIIDNFFSNFSNIENLKDNFEKMEWSKYFADGIFLEYGVFFDLFSVLLEKTLNIKNIHEIYFLKHLLNFLFFYISSIVFFFLIKRRFTNDLLAIIAVFFYITSPRFFAESFYNPKDIVFMSLTVITIFFGINLLKNLKIKNIILFCFFSALATSVRSMGIFSVFLILFFYILENLEEQNFSIKKIRIFILIFLLYFFFTYLLWPFLWLDPINNFFISLKSFANYGWGGSILYLGEYVKANNLPWHYTIVWIFVSNPIIYILLFIIGLYKIVFNFFANLNKLWKNSNEKIDLFIFAFFLGPLIAVIIFNSTLYNGWRHLYFIYPSLIYISILGLNYLLNIKINKLYRNATLSIIFLAIFINILNIIKLHPFQNIYFNFLVEKKANSLFDIDYWGLGNAHSIIKVINDEEKGKKIVMATASFTPLNYSKYIINKEKIKNINFPGTIKTNADYIFTNFIYEGDPRYKKKYLIPKNYKKFYTLKKGNIIINEVYKKKSSN